MVVRYIFSVFVFAFSWVNTAEAYSEGGFEKLIPMMRCAGIYSAASYAVRNFEDLEIEEGQTRQQVADDFQRLANILRYFATNSGYEKTLQRATREHIDDALAIIKMSEDFGVIEEELEHCDNYVDQLHSLYND